MGGTYEVWEGWKRPGRDGGSMRVTVEAWDGQGGLGGTEEAWEGQRKSEMDREGVGGTEEVWEGRRRPARDIGGLKRT